jgi:hypothetical protein
VRRTATGSVRPWTPLTATLLLLLPIISAAQAFSADVVFTPVSGKPVENNGRPAAPTVGSAKLYVQKDQLRFESHGVSGEALIVDDASQTTVALFPKDRTYQPLASRPSDYFRVADAEHACPDWQKAVGRKIDCTKAGEEAVDGRRSVKYRRQLQGEAAEYVWIDRALKFVTKWRTDQNEAQLRNIQEGPQPAELFTVPQNYKLLTPRKSKTSPLAR